MLNLSEELKKDVLRTCGSIHVMNCADCAGYEFHENSQGNKIALGGFLSRGKKSNLSYVYTVSGKYMTSDEYNSTLNRNPQKINKRRK